MHVTEKAMRLGGNTKAGDLKSIRYLGSCGDGQPKNFGRFIRNLINGKGQRLKLEGLTVT